MMRYLWNSEVLPEGFVRGLTLLFYKGQGKDKNDPGSYRPVTCLLGKDGTANTDWEPERNLAPAMFHHALLKL